MDWVLGTHLVKLADQISCIEREIRLRKGVYRKLVTMGKWTQEKADLELARMEAVLLTLQALPKTSTIENLHQS